MANTMAAAICRKGLNAIVIVANTHKMALHTSSYSPGQTTWSNANEITGTGYTTGGATLSGVTNATGAAKSYADASDPSWTTATFSGVAWAVWYDSTTGDIVAEYDLGGSFGVTAGTFTLIFPAATQSTAAIQL